MCGIVGAVSPHEVDRASVERMRDRLAHRGPDHAGSWLGDDGHVGFGHRRLAILDLTPEANQPFVSGDLVLTFNGEIYNWPTLRSTLADAGVEFRTHSDTEVLLEAYRMWGDACVERLWGMFSFALWDGARRRLVCARDRAGEKPFYYAWVDGAWPGFRQELDYTAVADFLTYGFVPDPKTIWSGASKLPPGHLLTVAVDGDGRPRVESTRPYWDLEFEPDHAVDDWGEEIRAALEEAAGEMAVADVPVGAFLSGGVDSSAVTAALSRSGHPLNAYTIGFEDDTFDERPFARIVADRYTQTHVERTVGASDMERVFRDTILWHYDEPFNDYSYLPTYYVCREARTQITVALSGDGGDELFAGYGKYRRLAVRQGAEPILARGPSRRVLAGAAVMVPQRSALRSRLHAYSSHPVTLLADMLATGFDSAELRRIARGDLAATLRSYDPGDVLRTHLLKAPPEKVGLVNAMRYLDFKLTLGGGILTKVDRASMAVSLEVRPVLLHPRMLALAARIPPERLASRQEAKTVLKSAVRPWLPRAIVDRPKMGFAAPLGSWLGGELAPLLESVRRPDARVASLVDGDYARGLVTTHQRGGAAFPLRLHSLFFLENWLETWH